MSATRSFATLASRALVRPTYTTSLRNGAISNVDSLCQRGLKSAATASATWARGVGHKTGRISFAQRISTSRVNQLQQVRWQSQKGEGETPELKRWGFEDINAALPRGDAILIDVREPVELTSTGIIPSAVSIPLASQPDALFLTPEEFETRFGFPKPGVSEEEAKRNVVFYCKAGVRARAAAQLAAQAGYDPARIGVYDGSWLDWAEHGGKVEKWEPEE
ncbi:RNA polymerase C-22 sterol desaturase [Paecilomyces lecythidis]|uniref:RNA polymerase C-22 sterol desaturase n=1 Tax=Paecilomyces lecythidis TaxID=3004212 RepID=A0ABR3Y0B9_9EURO